MHHFKQQNNLRCRRLARRWRSPAKSVHIMHTSDSGLQSEFEPQLEPLAVNPNNSVISLNIFSTLKERQACQSIASVIISGQIYLNFNFRTSLKFTWPGRWPSKHKRLSYGLSISVRSLLKASPSGILWWAISIKAIKKVHFKWNEFVYTLPLQKVSNETNQWQGQEHLRPAWSAFWMILRDSR